METALPIVITREGKWYVASCPILDIATQGRTELEVKRNIRALINEYLKDPDTHKPNLRNLLDISISTISVSV